MFEWYDDMNCAVTVCDTEGSILYMNKKSKETFGDKTGENLMGCHSDRSKGIIADFLDKGGTNAYTIEKKGVRKMIYQTAWCTETGAVGGLVEISMVIPNQMPHYVR